MTSDEGEGWMSHHHHEKGEKTDGTDTFNSIVAIKYLKLGKYLILGKLLLLVVLLGGLATAGVTLSPLALPLLAFPIALAALLLFIPLFALAFVVVAFKSTLLLGKKRRKMFKNHESGSWRGQGRTAGLSDAKIRWILAAVDRLSLDSD